MGAGTAPTERQPKFGELVPYGDPLWYSGKPSPYYTRSHHAWRKHVRDFVEREIEGNCDLWDRQKALPRELYRKAGLAGILQTVVGCPYPHDFSDVPAPAGFDYFHELITLDELGRCGSGGVLWGLVEGLQIGLPPLLNFGMNSSEVRARVARECFSGNKIICLCITEPTAGSDVASIRCTAEKDPTGQYYIVNGAKKWITNGVFADYFTVAVRTGGPRSGAKGISMLLLEKSMPGISCKQMRCMGVHASGTTYIEFEDVQVPVSHLIGEENNGFKQIMYNFNHERWGFVAQANRLSRVCYEEAFKYAIKRRTFGKPLSEHPVIRHKLGEMVRQIEANHAILESLTYQMNAMSKDEASRSLGGLTALTKVQATKTFEYCAREAAQIFGGASYVQGGLGEKVERLYRDVRAYAIPGGSEEIMTDFGVRQGLKEYQTVSKL